jgi:outer membrane protein assembly factor BamD (BamD/ComL family)
MNDTLMRESNERIAQAYLNAGKIFKEQLNRPAEALYYFNWLNTRFPEDQRLLFSYYNMYEIYSAQKNLTEMNKYKDLILQKFPDSRSAKIIANPNYFQELDDERAAVVKFYEDTYSDYQGRNYKTVINNCEKADTAFKLNPIRDKFGLLRIMAFARVNPTDTADLVKSINDLVFKYPDSEVADPARNLLNYLQRGPSEAIGKTTRKVQVGVGAPEVTDNKEDLKYIADESATHFYAVVVSGSTVDVGKLKFRISNFNVDKYTEDLFEVSSTLLDNDLQIITVKNFTNKKKAMDYYQAIIADPNVYADMKDTDYRHFVITKDNYTRLYKNKDVFGYYQFFRDNYLNQ